MPSAARHAAAGGSSARKGKPRHTAGFFALLLLLATGSMLTWQRASLHCSGQRSIVQTPIQTAAAAVAAPLPEPWRPTFVLGTTTAARAGASYLVQTLRSLGCALAADASARPPHPPTLLLLNTEVPASKHDVFQALAVAAPLLNLSAVRLRLRTLPKLHTLLAAALRPDGSHTLTDAIFHDPPARLWWRAKEALDTATLWEWALQLSANGTVGPAAWYVHLQDDVRFNAGFLSRLAAHIAAQRARGAVHDVYSLFSISNATAPGYEAYGDVGLVALAFNMSTMLSSGLVQHIRQHWSEKPVDLLLKEWMSANGKTLGVLVPSTVQHVGTTSSLRGKKQLRVSTSFVRDQCW